MFDLSAGGKRIATPDRVERIEKAVIASDANP
jgi:hypothetical protein